MISCVLEHGVSLVKNFFIIREHGKIFRIELAKGSVYKSAALFRAVTEKIHMAGGENNPADCSGIFRRSFDIYSVFLKAFSRGKCNFGILFAVLGKEFRL